MAGAEGIEKLYAEYQRALAVERSRLREEDLDRARLEAHLPLLARLDAVEDSSVVVYDLGLGRNLNDPVRNTYLPRPRS